MHYMSWITLNGSVYLNLYVQINWFSVPQFVCTNKMKSLKNISENKTVAYSSKYLGTIEQSLDAQCNIDRVGVVFYFTPSNAARKT